MPSSVAWKVVMIAPNEWPSSAKRSSPSAASEQVDVAGEDVERERLGVDPVAAPLAALVDVQQPELVAERVEPRPEHRVVEAGPAVQHDQREAVADLLDEQPVAVGELDVHGGAAA